MKTSNVICESCGILFKKPLKEVTRSLKMNRKQYCSRSCAGKSVANITHILSVNPLDSSHLNPANRRDEYTFFRAHLRRIRARNINVELKLEDLKEVWDTQKGICVYSKVQLIQSKHFRKNNPIYTMSLDRKDSNLGYIKGNIQFISIAMNLMKNSMKEEEMQELLHILKHTAD